MKNGAQIPIQLHGLECEQGGILKYCMQKYFWGFPICLKYNDQCDYTKEKFLEIIKAYLFLFLTVSVIVADMCKKAIEIQILV